MFNSFSQGDILLSSLKYTFSCLKIHSRFFVIMRFLNQQIKSSLSFMFRNILVLERGLHSQEG